VTFDVVAILRNVDEVKNTDLFLLKVVDYDENLLRNHSDENSL
jgi:hypothetical protein